MMPEEGLTRTDASLLFTARQFHNRWPILFIRFFAFSYALLEKLGKESADEAGLGRHRDKLSLRDRPASIKCYEIGQGSTSA